MLVHRTTVQPHPQRATAPEGTGKTHLAIAIGLEACRRKHRVRFYTASQLANLYLEAREERQVTKLEGQIKRHDLIIIDELGYIPLDRRGAEHLFSFFSQCYEQTSLIVTTNLPSQTGLKSSPTINGWSVP